MRKKLFVSGAFVFIFTAFSATILLAFNPQYLSTIPVIYTPNGTAVTTGLYVSNELALYEKQQMMQYVTQMSNVTILAEPTAKYNCYNYAWVKTKEDQNVG